MNEQVVVVEEKHEGEEVHQVLGLLMLMPMPMRKERIG
jgi:hypothetical protein